jgi:hypothetical protein
LLTGFLSASVTVPETVCEEAVNEKNTKETKKNTVFAEAASCLSFFLIIARGFVS